MTNKTELEEIWKSISITKNKSIILLPYDISNKGRCRNQKTKYMLKLSMHNGYYYIAIKNKRYSAHSLVATAFIPNPNKYPIANHIDGNKSNNCVENLE